MIVDALRSDTATLPIGYEISGLKTCEICKNDVFVLATHTVDKLDGVAKAFGLQVWQLFVPGMDISQPPVLASDAHIAPALTPEEKKLLDAFRKLSTKERDYLLADAKKYLTK